VRGYCRSAYRSRDDPSFRSDNLGFRVARSQSETVTAAERRQQGAQVAVEARPKIEKTEPVKKVFKGESVTNSIKMELIEIPAGKFTMGSPEGEEDRQEDEAQVRVTLTKSFGLGKTEVTQGQWSKVMARRPIDEVLMPHIKPWKDCPAAYVDWDEATEFCKKLTAIERKAGKLKANEEYRLPTEAEWEYACRAGTTTAFSFGDDESKLGEYAWYDGNTKNIDREWAHKVGTKKPNPWGLHDMHGNVAEWCEDWHDEKLSGGVDPVGLNAGYRRVIRGGDWDHDASDCRSAYRGNYGPASRSISVGFRIVRVLL
jgi:formylglycine-generating enzyme